MLHGVMRGLFVALLMINLRLGWCDEPTVPATALIGDNAVIVVHVAKPQELIERAADERAVRLVQSLPPYQEAMARQETRDALGVVDFFKAKYQVDLPQLLTKLIGGGITLAVEPDDRSLLVVDAVDGEALQAVHDFLRTVVQGEARKQGDPDRVKSADYRGITGWSFAPGESHAIVGNRLLVANKPEVLKGALDRLLDSGGPSIQDAARYPSAMRSLGDSAQVRVFVDLSAFNQLPAFQQAMTQDDNPLGRLLLAPFLVSVRDASWLAVGLDMSQDRVCLRFLADRQAARESALDAFAIPTAEDGGAMPNLEVPRQIAGMSFYRDLHKFYAAKDELFPQRTGGLIFFENMMGIFFSGRDLTQEVLAQTLPDLRVVVAQQGYDETTGVPALQLPGAAIVVRLKDAERFSLVMKEAWQKAIGLVNFTRGQGALPGLIIDTIEHAGIRYTTAHFSLADEKDPHAVDIRFNFQPSLATQGDYLIMSSSEGLLRDLIDGLQAESQQQVRSVPGQHTAVTVDGGALASILDANREALVRQRMVDDGQTREEAARDIAGILAVLRYLQQLHVSAGTTADQSTLVIELGYELP